MNIPAPRRAPMRLPDLLESVNMSPGERARARAQCEQIEAFVDAVSALVHRIRGLRISSASGHPGPRKPVHP